MCPRWITGVAMCWLLLANGANDHLIDRRHARSPAAAEEAPNSEGASRVEPSSLFDDVCQQ